MMRVSFGASCMSMLLLLSIGCSNVSLPEWSGGGARYASGYTSQDVDDTAGGDTATTGSEGAPVLLTGSAQYDENEAGELYIQAGIAYEDAPDDVIGGALYFTVLADGVSEAQGSRNCVGEDANALTEALIENGQISFSVGPVDDEATHQLVAYVVDYTHNTSNQKEISVTGR